MELTDDLKKYVKPIYIYKMSQKGLIYLDFFVTIYETAIYLKVAPEEVKEVLEHKKPYLRVKKTRYVLSRKR